MARPKNKPIVELDKPNGKVIKYFISSKDAADFYNMNQANISYNINKKYHQAKGHYFRLANSKEIADYNMVEKKLRKEDNTNNQPKITTITIPSTMPVEVIPERPEDTDNQRDEKSPFDRLLDNYKNKFNNNTE